MPGTHLSPELHKELRAAGRPLKKRQGSVLFRAGTRGRGAYLVRKGQVRLTLERGTGLYPSRTLGPGTVVGLPATVSGEPYSLTAEAVQDCDLDFIPRKQLLSLIRGNTAVAFQILQILSEEIYQMRNTVRLATSPVTGSIH